MGTDNVVKTKLILLFIFIKVMKQKGCPITSNIENVKHTLSESVELVIRKTVTIFVYGFKRDKGNGTNKWVKHRLQHTDDTRRYQTMSKVQY